MQPSRRKGERHVSRLHSLGCGGYNAGFVMEQADRNCIVRDTRASPAFAVAENNISPNRLRPRQIGRVEA